MARISFSFVLLALAAATSAAAGGSGTGDISTSHHVAARGSIHHPGAEVVGFEKRSGPRVSAAGSSPAPRSKPATHKRKRRAHGAKRAVDPSIKDARSMEEVPQPAKRDLNTPSDPSKLHTVALTRAHNPDNLNGLHPQIYLQQHINRGVRRLHGMTKRNTDLDDEFEGAIRKRWISVHGHDDALKIKKRSPQRGGYAMSDSVDTGTSATDDAKQLKGDNNGAGAAAGAGAGTGAAAGAGAAAGGDTANSAGFSQAELDAATKGTITKGGQASAANSLTLNIEANDVGYFATMQAGTPPKDFKVLLDSGSADFWVAGENCKTCGKHQNLGAGTSSSFVDTGKPFQVSYGTGNVAGNIIQDSINIAGLQLNNHTFGANNQESQDFGDDTVPFDSLMGLAISTLAEQKTPTPIESLASNKLVAAPQMGFALGRVADGANIGQATFGGVDQSKFQGDLTLFDNVNKQGFWEGAMADVTVDGKSAGLKGRTAILDTGTTLVIAPPDDAAAVHAAIPGAQADGQGGFTVPCTTSAKVAMQFGGKSFEMDPRDLAFQPVSNNLQGDCVSSISSGQIGGAQEWLVGDAFLKSVYFATDVQNNQIGLAPITAGNANAAGGGAAQGAQAGAGAAQTGGAQAGAGAAA